MPDYRTALELSKRAVAAPRATTLEEHVDVLPLWADLTVSCQSGALPAPSTPGDSIAYLSDDLGWSMIEILTAGVACLTEVNRRLYATMDGAVKARDFIAPRTEVAPSITS
jgi:hypothetical protein